MSAVDLEEESFLFGRLLSYILHENERLKENAILIFQKRVLIWFDRLLKGHFDEKFDILEREYFVRFLYLK